MRPARRARRVAPALALAAAAVLAGCGTPSADLLVIERAGRLPDADLSLVVGDGGAVECDGRERSISSERLLEARRLVDDLEPLLSRRARLPASEEALLRFRVTGEAGVVTFADASPNQPPVLGRVLRFTRDVSTEACGRER